MQGGSQIRPLLLEEQQPDVVIFDLLMSGLDGIELTQKVTQRWPNIRIVILTVQDRHDSVQQALASGANAYILKMLSRWSWLVRYTTWLTVGATLARHCSTEPSACFGIPRHTLHSTRVTP